MISDNLKVISDRIRTAAMRVNRAPDTIKLVAVSKHVPGERIMQAVESGQSIFGENYVQEAQQKIPLIKKSLEGRRVLFHFIGKLQSNKAGKAAELFDVIETVDSIKLARLLDKHLASLNKVMDAYLQVNIGREKQKSGILPEDCQQVLNEITDLQHLKVVGLMTMPPFSADPEQVRPCFRDLRRLSEKMTALKLLGRHGPVQLSMGMSGDFETAIEEGATVVRIGTAIFGQR